METTSTTANNTSTQQKYIISATLLIYCKERIHNKLAPLLFYGYLDGFCLLQLDQCP